MVKNTLLCVCGHAEDEHGGDEDYPGSYACDIEGCECIHYDEDEEVGDG